MVNKTIEPTCDNCKILVNRFKHLHKVNGNFLCNQCYIEHKQNKRKELIETDLDLKEDLRQLKNISAKEYREINKEEINKKKREEYHQSNQEARTYNKSQIKLPVIRGSKEWKRNHRPNNSNSYLTVQEKQRLFGFLVRKGLCYEEADKRIKSLVKNLQEVREQLRLKNKSEEQLKVEKYKMLEELYNYQC